MPIVHKSPSKPAVIWGVSVGTVFTMTHVLFNSRQCVIMKASAGKDRARSRVLTPLRGYRQFGAALRSPPSQNRRTN